MLIEPVKTKVWFRLIIWVVINPVLRDSTLLTLVRTPPSYLTILIFPWPKNHPNGTNHLPHGDTLLTGTVFLKIHVSRTPRLTIQILFNLKFHLRSLLKHVLLERASKNPFLVSFWGMQRKNQLQIDMISLKGTSKLERTKKVKHLVMGGKHMKKHLSVTEAMFMHPSTASITHQLTMMVRVCLFSSRGARQKQTKIYCLWKIEDVFWAEGNR